MRNFFEKYQPLLGEFAWHSLTADSSIVSESQRHYDQVVAAINKWADGPVYSILEVGAYSHITGYMLQQHFKAKVTLFDLSVSTLKLGRQIAADQHILEDVDLYAGDFHSLPFEDDCFDVVYIYSALHHTNQFKRVARELQRVLAKGGLLLVMNEPYLRKSCFYKFSTNRPGAFTSFEKSLEAQGIIRMVAEPHLGSRDESLFGMVENQKIPLQDFVDVFSEDCEIEEMTTDYETQLGEIEKIWLAWAKEREGQRKYLAEKIAADLKMRIREASKHYDDIARGLGFELPETEAVDDFGDAVAGKLSELASLQEEPCWYRRKASELFGGSVSIVAKKNRDVLNKRPAECSIAATCKLSEIAGIKLAFPNEINKLLQPGKSLIPVFNGENIDGIQRFFPREYWSIEKQDNGFYAATLLGNRGSMVLPASTAPYLLMLRINFVCQDLLLTPCSFLVTDHRTISYSYDVFQEEAVLFQQYIETQCEEKEIKLDLQVTAISRFPHRHEQTMAVKIYYAGLFSI